MYRHNRQHPALFALGFISIGTQLCLVRESMMVFNENELIIGIVLAMWMVITGAGSFLGRYGAPQCSGVDRTVAWLLVAGMMPPLMVAGLDFLKALLVPYGSMAGLRQILVACLAVQLPFCLLNGYLFTRLCTTAPAGSLSGSYAWESLGSMTSGGLVNLFLFLGLAGVPGFNPDEILLIICAVYVLIVAWYAKNRRGRKFSMALLALSVAWLVFLGFNDLRAMARERLYPGQKVVSVSETPYGQVLVTKTGNQFNFFENGMLLFSTGNEIGNEENVHYAMVQHPAPDHVLLISGGYAGTLAEILKYRPSRVDYVELNPALAGIARRFTRQLQHPAVRVHETDARRFIRKTDVKYDVVLVNLPAPSTLQVNRYYSRQFMQEVARTMNPGAVIAYSLPTGADYVSREGGRMNSLLWNTLKECFPNVLVVPGGRNYFLASGAPLSIDIPGLVKKRGIETAYVSEYYLDTEQMKKRSAMVTPSGPETRKESATLAGPVNTDFSPVAVWYQMSWWLSHFGVNPVVIIIVFFLILTVLVLTLNPVSAGLFAGGFTLASSEIILVFGLQVLCGYLFQAVGVLIMVFMVGLAAGAGIPVKKGPHVSPAAYRWLQLGLGGMALLTPLILQGLNLAGAGEWLVNGTVAALAFTLAFIAGLEFRAAARLSGKSLQQTVAGNYSAEMFGSAAGAFCVALFLIPAIGITGTGIILALMNLATALLMYPASRIPHPVSRIIKPSP